MKRTKTIQKKPIFLATSIFVGSASLIVIIHSFILGYGFDISMTISKYIGLAPWSALFFLLSGLAMCALTYGYYRHVEEILGLSKFWRVMSTITIAMMVALCVFPIGLFDGGSYTGTVSKLHRLTSSTMFLSAWVYTLGLIAKIEDKPFRMIALGFAVYAAIMIIFFISNLKFFWDYALIFESLYLLYYLATLCLIPNKQTILNP